MNEIPPQYMSSGAPQTRKSKWWVPILIIFFVLFAGLFLLIVGSIVLVKGSLQEKPVTVLPNTVVQLRVPGSIEEVKSIQGYSILDSGSSSPSFLEVLQAIQRAKKDRRVIGLYYRSGDLSMGFAKATELRDALIDFKKSGKFIRAYLDIGGELDYYFASVADSIYMASEGMQELNGFAISELFWKGTLDKLGVDVMVQHFEEYKSAGESYSRKNFSEPARQELRILLQQRSDCYIDAISTARNLTANQVTAALDEGLYSADSMLACHFIDGICSETEVKNDLLGKKADSSLAKNHMLSLSKYISSAPVPSAENLVKDKEIAIINACGMIVPGSNDNGPFSDAMVASQTFTRYLRLARENSRIKIIILRIDSPGGSVLASDAIYREILETRKVKPV
jgi:protease IV